VVLIFRPITQHRVHGALPNVTFINVRFSTVQEDEPVVVVDETSTGMDAITSSRSAETPSSFGDPIMIRAGIIDKRILNIGISRQKLA
jgi:hypothetical protein